MNLNICAKATVSTVIFIFFLCICGFRISWFLLPCLFIFLIGIYNVIQYIEEEDVFSVTGIVWCLLLYFFSIAPILHYVNSYYYHGFAIRTVNWNLYISIWSVLNIIGLLFYYTITKSNINLFKNKKNSNYTSVDDIKISWLLSVGFIFLLISSVMQYTVYTKFGGIEGYILAKEEYGANAFKGMGLNVLVSESFPIVLSILIVIYFRIKGIRSFSAILFSLIIFLCIKLIFGGLAGSRSNIIWGLFWFSGMIHIFIRPFSKKHMGIALIFLMMFMAIYGVYKKNKTEFFDAIETSGISDNNYYGSSNPLMSILLTDFSRVDIQSYEIFSQDSGMYKNLRYGETYLNAISRFIPFGTEVFSFDNKVKAGTEMIFNTEGEYSTRLYGLIGEFMLNFPYQIYPIIFIPFGVFVLFIKKFREQRRDDDIYLLLYPFLVNSCIVILIADLDNVLYFFLKNGVIPVLFILLIKISSPKRIV